MKSASGHSDEHTCCKSLLIWKVGCATTTKDMAPNDSPAIWTSSQVTPLRSVDPPNLLFRQDPDGLVRRARLFIMSIDYSFLFINELKARPGLILLLSTCVQYGAHDIELKIVHLFDWLFRTGGLRDGHPHARDREIPGQKKMC
jgi:hypothetical protein